VEALRKTCISRPGFESMTPRNKGSAEILKGRSFQLWRGACIRYVFAIRGRMHADSDRFLREFPRKNPRLLRKETATGPSICFFSFSYKYNVQLIHHSEIK